MLVSLVATMLRNTRLMEDTWEREKSGQRTKQTKSCRETDRMNVSYQNQSEMYASLRVSLSKEIHNMHGFFFQF